jgi:hypothetical protein
MESGYLFVLDDVRSPNVPSDIRDCVLNMALRDGKYILRLVKTKLAKLTVSTSLAGGYTNGTRRSYYSPKQPFD